MAKAKKVKEFSRQVTQRFLQAMKQVIALEKEGITTRSEFAVIIGEYGQNISKMEQGSRYPTLESICRICTIFKVNPEWVLLGEGDMWNVEGGSKTLMKRLNEIESSIKKIEKLEKKAKKK